MSLKPRHFVLIAVVIGIFIFNLYRHRQPKLSSEGAAPIITTNHIPAQTPAWSAFDHAAGLRDSAPADFDPSMQALQEQLSIATDPTVSDIKGCLTWLEFYRQGVLHPSKDPAWKDRSQHHLDGCVKYHLDTTAS
jgi:hypothetical protein